MCSSQDDAIPWWQKNTADHHWCTGSISLTDLAAVLACHTRHMILCYGQDVASLGLLPGMYLACWMSLSILVAQICSSWFWIGYYTTLSPALGQLQYSGFFASVSLPPSLLNYSSLTIHYPSSCTVIFAAGMWGFSVSMQRGCWVPHFCIMQTTVDMSMYW